MIGVSSDITSGSLAPSRRVFISLRKAIITSYSRNELGGIDGCFIHGPITPVVFGGVLCFDSDGGRMVFPFYPPSPRMRVVVGVWLLHGHFILDWQWIVGGSCTICMDLALCFFDCSCAMGPLCGFDDGHLIPNTMRCGYEPLGI